MPRGSWCVRIGLVEARSHRFGVAEWRVHSPAPGREEGSGKSQWLAVWAKKCGVVECDLLRPRPRSCLVCCSLGSAAEAETAETGNGRR